MDTLLSQYKWSGVPEFRTQVEQQRRNNSGLRFISQLLDLLEE